MSATTLPPLDAFLETIAETSIKAERWRNLETFSVEFEAAMIAVEKGAEEVSHTDSKDIPKD